MSPATGVKEKASPRTEGCHIRPATAADIPELIRLRRIMFRDLGYTDASMLDAVDAAAQGYLAEAIPSQQFVAWMAATPEGQVVGCGGVVMDHRPPSPMTPDGRCAYVLSLVTEPAFRRRGIARQIMETILQWLAEQGVRTVSLHASEQGQELYREFGFGESNEMRLIR